MRLIPVCKKRLSREGEGIVSQTILDVRDLKCHFQTRKGLVKAVDGVNLQVNEGEDPGFGR